MLSMACMFEAKIKSREFLKKLKKAGYIVKILKQKNSKEPKISINGVVVSLPGATQRGKDIDVGTAKSALKQAGLPPDIIDW